MIASAWKLTLDPAGTPLVLLDYGDMLAGELVFSGRRVVAVRPLVRAAAPNLFDGRNVSSELRFRVHHPAASWSEARSAAMATALAALAKDQSPLRIEATGVDGYTQYANCLVSDASGQIDEDEGSWYVIDYALLATSPTVTASAPYTAEDIVISGTLTPDIDGAIVRRVDTGDPITHAASTWSTDGTNTPASTGQWIRITCPDAFQETWRITVFQDGVNVASWTSYSATDPVAATWGYQSTGTATGTPACAFYVVP